MGRKPVRWSGFRPINIEGGGEGEELGGGGGAEALALAPQGAANVHGLIKTLVPVADAPPGSLVPLTAESRVLLGLPIAPDMASRKMRSMDAN